MVSSCLEFQRIIYKLVSVVREAPHLAGEVSAVIGELVKEYNMITCSQILGKGAHKNGQLSHITAKHLCKQSQSFTIYRPVSQLHVVCSRLT